MSRAKAQRLKRAAERLERKQLKSEARKEILSGKPERYDIGIIGTGKVARGILDAIGKSVSSDGHDEIGDILIASHRGLDSSSKTDDKKLRSFERYIANWRRDFGINNKVHYLDYSPQRILRSLMSTQIMFFSFGAPKFEIKKANSDVQVETYRALKDLGKNSFDYRVADFLPANIETVMEWSKAIRGYEGMVCIYTNPVDILCYVSASISGLTDQTSGFSHIDTCRLRGPLFSENVEPDNQRDIGDRVEEIYAIGDHGNGLVARTFSVDQFEKIDRAKLQELVRTYAPDTKVGDDNSIIRGEISPSTRELLDGMLSEGKGISASVFGRLHDFIEIFPESEEDRGIFTSFAVQYEHPYVSIDNIVLSDEEALDFKKSYNNIRDLIVSLKNRRIINTANPQKRKERKAQIGFSGLPVEGRLVVEGIDGRIDVYDISNIRSPNRVLEAGNVLDVSVSERSILVAKEGDKLHEYAFRKNGPVKEYTGAQETLIRCLNCENEVYAISEGALDRIFRWHKFDPHNPELVFDSEKSISDIATGKISGKKYVFMALENSIYMIDNKNTMIKTFHAGEDIIFEDLVFNKNTHELVGRTSDHLFFWDMTSEKPHRTLDIWTSMICSSGDSIYLMSEEGVMKYSIESGSCSKVCDSNKYGKIAVKNDVLFLSENQHIRVVDSRKNDEIFGFKGSDSKKIYSLSVI